MVAEKRILYKIDDFTIIKGMTQLSATYFTFHVNYPKSVPAQSFLMFIQEMLLDQKDTKMKRSAKYRTFISAITD